ncbi:DNA repair exonuclease [Paenibacillus oryzisoli]|uniref:metallophosphoesterase family protein n=1 Tax=Paenibacillus oryzisoli TaxID=1850517 RepID=UPI003D2C178A
MKRLRFLHAADLHLDSPFKGMSALPERIRERVRESTFDTLGELVRLAIRERVDFVLIAGDVYDVADRSLRAQIRFQQAVEQLSSEGIPTYLIHGNHDPQDGRAAQLDWPADVHFFACDRVETVQVIKEDRGIIAEVHGISYGTAAVTDNLAQRFAKGSEPVYQIGLLHTNVDGDANHDNYAPCTKQDLLRAGMDYWALGHVHTRQIIQAQGPVIVYPGNLQGRSIREQGPRGAYVVDVHEDGRADLSFQALDAVRWYEETLDTTAITTEQGLKDALGDLLDRVRGTADGRAAIVRVVLAGRSALHRLLRQGQGRALQELVDELREEEAEQSRFVWIESVVDRTASELDLAALAGENSFLGDLLRYADGLQQDEAALQAFADEALAALQGLPQSVRGSVNAEQLREWLRAAQQLAADLLTEEGGRRE